MSTSWIKERYFVEGSVSARALADNAVTADAIAAASIDDTKLSEEVERSATINVSSAELLALNATPKTLLAAPGAGKMIILEGAYIFLDYNSAAYADIGASEDLALRYTDGSGEIVATVEATGFLDQTADQRRWVAPTGFSPAVNAPLVLHMTTGEVTTGDSPLVVKLKYRVVAA